MYYYGRFTFDGKLVAAGMLSGGTLYVYSWRDGKFHYDPRHQKMYDEGDYDEISDEEFEKFKKEMEMKGREKEAKV